MGLISRLENYANSNKPGQGVIPRLFNEKVKAPIANAVKKADDWAVNKLKSTPIGKGYADTVDAMVAGPKYIAGQVKNAFTSNDAYAKQQEALGVRAASPSDNDKPAPTTLPQAWTQGGGTKGLISQWNKDVAASKAGSKSDVPKTENKDSSGGLSFTVDGKQYYSPSGNRMDAVPVQTTQTQQPQYPVTQTSTASSTSTAPNNSYGGLIAELAKMGREGNEKVDAARKALEDSRLAEAKALQQVADPENKYGRSLSYQMGAGNVLQNMYGNEQNALASTLGSELQSQGLQQQAIQSAAGMMSPMSFGLTMDPVTGQPINMSAMQVPMQTALQLYRAGTPLSDPAYSQALGPMGSAGWMMFYNQLQNGGGGLINPAAQSAAMGQQLGFATQLQGQNQQMGQGLAQLSALQPQVTSFMQAAGINPSDYPAMNEQIGKYLDRLRNPGASQQWEAIKTQLAGIVPSIIAAKQAGGMQINATEMLAVSDPGALSMNQLNALMNTWRALGGTSVGVNQGLYNQMGGFGGVYMGGNPNQGSFAPAPVGQGSLAGAQGDNSQAAAGALYNILSSPQAALNFVTQLFGAIPK